MSMAQAIRLWRWRADQLQLGVGADVVAVHLDVTGVSASNRIQSRSSLR